MSSSEEGDGAVNPPQRKEARRDDDPASRGSGAHPPHQQHQHSQLQHQQQQHPQSHLPQHQHQQQQHGHHQQEHHQHQQQHQGNSAAASSVFTSFPATSSSSAATVNQAAPAPGARPGKTEEWAQVKGKLINWFFSDDGDAVDVTFTDGHYLRIVYLGNKLFRTEGVESVHECERDQWLEAVRTYHDATSRIDNVVAHWFEPDEEGEEEEYAKPPVVKDEVLFQAIRATNPATAPAASQAK